MKKNGLKLLLALMLAATVALTGCSSGGGGDDDSVNTYGSGNTSVNIYLLASSVPSSSAGYNIWAWKKTSNTNYTSASWPGDMKLGTTTVEGYSFYAAVLNVDSSDDLGLLFVNSSGSAQTSDITIPKAELTAGKNYFFVWGVTTYYDNANSCFGIKKASITSKDGNEITISSALTSVDTSVLTVTGSDKTTNFTVTSATPSKITLSNGDISKAPYTITYDGTSIIATISGEIIDDLYTLSDADISSLGLTLDSNKATFKTWAPLASDVKLLLYKDSTSAGVSGSNYGGTGSTTDKGTGYATPAIDPISATNDSPAKNGIWTFTVDDVSSYKYYKYQIENNGTTYYVADIWNPVANPDSYASQIVSINDSSAKPNSAKESYDSTKASYKNPFKGESYSNAVIYEMHIRDWAKALNSSENDGKFAEITEGLSDSGALKTHLTDLGVTHVQILPIFDYSQSVVNETYNWGYNPYHYNVPEGRYVDYGDNKDGTDAVKQLRAMIEAFHEAGIAVIMDVVYNHTNGTGSASLYDSTVPEYFYRLDSSGNYCNGSGCGNEVATNHKIVKKYVIESLKHWMLDYHINGFRFDLMGCFEQETMQEIYDALYEIDPKVMIYGEPWTGGTAGVSNGTTAALKPSGTNSSSSKNGIGAFDDVFRNAIKGAEFDGFSKGQVQGNFSDTTDEAIITGLLGNSTTRNKTEIPALSLHYVECHDNYTLFDKLAISYLNKTSYSGDLFSTIGSNGLSAVKAQDKLAAAYVFLSNGIPFINGGQEFLRTKKGNENSYNADDTINAIDLNMKTTYSDVYNVYKGLIALRTSSTAFTAPTSATAETLQTGVTLYKVSNGTDNYSVVFNATDKDVTLKNKINGNVVTISNGSVEDATSSSDTESVSAKSFVIIKTKADSSSSS